MKLTRRDFIIDAIVVGASLALSSTPFIEYFTPFKPLSRAEHGLLKRKSNYVEEGNKKIGIEYSALYSAEDVLPVKEYGSKALIFYPGCIETNKIYKGEVNLEIEKPQNCEGFYFRMEFPRPFLPEIKIKEIETDPESKAENIKVETGLDGDVLELSVCSLDSIKSANINYSVSLKPLRNVKPEDICDNTEINNNSKLNYAV